jgi:hypothetical protein
MAVSIVEVCYLNHQQEGYYIWGVVKKVTVIKVTGCMGFAVEDFCGVQISY